MVYILGSITKVWAVRDSIFRPRWLETAVAKNVSRKASLM